MNPQDSQIHFWAAVVDTRPRLAAMPERPIPRASLATEGQEPVEPRPAATVILLRAGPGHGALEVLLVERNRAQRFMGGMWVFPGGAVDTDEGEGDTAQRVAGVREVWEEVGVRLADPTALVRYSRWITPAEISIRFDTHFFLARLPAGAEPHADGEECVDLAWFTPGGALTMHERGELPMVFPTIKHLEQLAPFATPAALLDWATGRAVVPVQPQIVGSGEQARLVLPGEPGYIA